MHISPSTLVLWSWTVLCSCISDHVTSFLRVHAYAMPNGYNTRFLFKSFFLLFQYLIPLCCFHFFFLENKTICLLTLTFLNQWERGLLQAKILTAQLFPAFHSGVMWTSGGMLAVWKHKHLTPQRPATVYASHHCSHFNALVWWNSCPSERNPF